MYITFTTTFSARGSQGHAANDLICDVQDDVIKHMRTQLPLGSCIGMVISMKFDEFNRLSFKVPYDPEIDPAMAKFLDQMANRMYNTLKFSVGEKSAEYGIQVLGWTSSET